MFDSIFIGTTGLLNHAKGLRVVGNNLANVNTSGFKSSQLQFSNMFEQGGGSPQLASGSGNGSGMGNGVGSLGSQVNFRAGLDQSTGNPLDVAISGNGFYAIKRDGNLLYTRSGDFRFDDKGILVNSTGDHVQGLDSGGQLVDITLDTMGRSLAKATTSISFTGILTTTEVVPPVSTGIQGVTVLDANGVDHPLTLSFAKSGSDFNVTVVDAAGAAVATGIIKFAGKLPIAGSDTMSFTYTPNGGNATTIKLDFSKNVTAEASPSTLGVFSQDGYAAGVRTDQTIAADGTVTVQYSNGQTAKGQRIALADFTTEDALVEGGGAAFKKTANAPVQYGFAGTGVYGNLVAGHREGSNVDLAEEFGNLILMQRGYQAASHVISTANDMIQQLFDMKGR